MLEARHVPAADLAENLRVLRAVIAEQLATEESKIAIEYLDHALSQFDSGAAGPSHLSGDDPLTVIARRYLDALLSGDRRLAATLITDAVNGGTDVRDIYLRVFQPALYEIGRLWQGNEISVAQEHYSSAATQLIMSQLYPRIFNAARRGQTLIAACAPGDLHEIGLRALCDYFELAGWDTHYLGGNVPIPDLLDLLSKRHADVLALSATMTFHLAAIRATIGAVRKREEYKHVVILAGGHPFNLVSDLWRSVGADGCARDAGQALQVAEALLATRDAP
jgi:methanogenic corrinoid protein MtbC1